MRYAYRQKNSSYCWKDRIFINILIILKFHLLSCFFLPAMTIGFSPSVAVCGDFFFRNLLAAGDGVTAAAPAGLEDLGRLAAVRFPSLPLEIETSPRSSKFADCACCVFLLMALR